MIERVYTIGVYGKTEDSFFGQLGEARIEIFCDIRRRRGVRGSQYSFVNSKYLQRALANRSIAYRYVPALAPSRELREAQHVLDREKGILKRARKELGEEFKRRYAREVLDLFDSRAFARSFEPKVTRIVLFCVEGLPEACHRSLVADRLQYDWKVVTEHL
jgi:uncharacterized protein (DUF488 family)